MSIPTPNFESAIAKAVAREKELGVDLAGLAEHVREMAPTDLNTPEEQQERRDFLDSLYHEDREAKQAFERIIAGNELQDANFLARGGLVSRAVARIVLRGPGGAERGFGTGFMIGDGVLITNNHVLRNADVAATSEAQFRYERDLLGNDQLPVRFALEPGRLFFTSKELDFTIVAVAGMDRTGQSALGGFGWLPLIGVTGKVVDGEWLTIIQHPQGQRKQLCVRENQLIKRADDVLWYSTDTLAGSSGSPVFNNDWLVVALHHSGVPETKDGKWQTTDGRDYQKGIDSEDKIKWVANEGIRVSRIIQTLKEDPATAGHALVQSVLQAGGAQFDALLPVVFPDGKTPAVVQAAMALVHAAPSEQAASAPAAFVAPDNKTRPVVVKVAGGGQESAVTQRVSVTLEIDGDGEVRIVGTAPAHAGQTTEEVAKAPKYHAPVEPERDWINGFDRTFLGKDDLSVNLPRFSEAMARQIAPLKPESVYNQPVSGAAVAKQGVLNYDGYSVVMHAKRRIAFYSAANVNGGVNLGLGRPKDQWLFDDRISRDHQLGDNYYVGTRLNRGHLTRREDLEWGMDPVEATRRANGTCTWTNCSPQHELFNQDKHPDNAIRLWGGLEKYLLELSARAYQFRLQVFTGPIFDDNDPPFRGAKIPMRFWKIVVAKNVEGWLYATAYILTQSDVLDMDSLLKPGVEEGAVIGAFQLYQRPIAEVEAATGLKFTYGSGSRPKSLRGIDVFEQELKKPVWKRRKRSAGPGTQESFGGGDINEDGRLESFDDIVLG